MNNPRKFLLWSAVLLLSFGSLTSALAHGHGWHGGGWHHGGYGWHHGGYGWHGGYGGAVIISPPPVYAYNPYYYPSYNPYYSYPYYYPRSVIIVRSHHHHHWH